MWDYFRVELNISKRKHFTHDAFAFVRGWGVEKNSLLYFSSSPKAFCSSQTREKGLLHSAHRETMKFTTLSFQKDIWLTAVKNRVLDQEDLWSDPKGLFSCSYLKDSVCGRKLHS